MLISVDILPEVFLYSCGSGLLFWLLYRHYIFSVVDPLFIFVITTSFASVLVLKTVEDPRNIIHYFICELSAWAGFAWIQKRTGNPAVQVSPKKVDVQFTDVMLLRYTNYILFSIYLVANLIILRTKGFALLSDAPTTAKVANFQEGFGIFRKINWAVGGVSSAGLLFLYILERKRIDILMFLLIVGFSALEGSKSALLHYVVMALLLVYHPAFRHQERLRRQIKQYAPLTVIAVFAVIFAVLIRENSDTEGVLLAFVRRLLYGADSTLFFYNPANIEYFTRYSWTDFPNYIINPILGFLRLAPYQEAFGNVMVENTLPPGVTMDVIVGPNSSFYIEGQVFFGFYGAFVYSFVLGCLTSWMRTMYFSLIHSSAFALVFLNVIYQFSTLILTDLKLFITQSFDAILLVLPVYVLICFIVNRKLIIRRLRFN